MSYKRRRTASNASLPSAKKNKRGQSTHTPNNVSVDGAAEPVFPNVWEDIPKLLFVDMQKEEANDVGDALDSLTLLMSDNDDNSDQNAKEAFRLGAPAVTVLVMRKFQYNEDLQGCGCSCLQMLAFHPPNRNKLAKCGVMEVLVSALRIFPDSAYVQEAGLAALQNLFGNFNAGKNLRQAADRFVGELDGIGLILKAMKKFTEEAELLANCCGIFWALVDGNEEFKEKMIAAEAVPAVQAVAHKHPNHEGVQETTSMFLKLMAPPPAPSPPLARKLF